MEAGLKAQIARLTSEVAGQQARSAADVASLQATINDLRASLTAKGRQVTDLKARLAEVEVAEAR